MNKFTAYLSGGLFALALTFGIAAPSAQAADVVDTAAGVADLSTLVSLVQAAGLVDALKDAEDITVFAPVNSAFDKLPRSVSRAIERDPSILTKILLFHVSPDRLSSSEVVATRRIDTLTDQDIRVRAAGKKVFVDRAQVIATDIDTDNATVHLINRVMIPWHLIRDDVVTALRHR